MTDAARRALARPGPDRPATRRVWVPVLAVCAYLAIACLAYWPVEPLSRSHLSLCACSDVVQETWFLAWPAYAVRHLRNPFFTSYLNAPSGVNLALNTSMPLLGVLAAPITWARGPVAAFNVMMRLSFATSATSMMFVLRGFAKWWPAAFLGGLLYGFSPYMVGQGNGHLFLTFVPLPPLICYCVYRLLAARPGDHLNVRRFGLLLGGLCVAQFLISIEVLVTTAVFVLVALVAVLVRNPARFLDSAGVAARGIGWALALFVPLVAYPTWFFLAGPQHVSGPPHAVGAIAPFRADLLGPIVPSLNELIGPARLLAIGSSYAAGNRVENGIYLGIPLLLVVLALTVRCRREGVVPVAAFAGLVALVLSMGTPLTIGNHAKGIPLPFALLTHVPLLQGVVALRFALYTQMAAAFVLGVGLDRLRREGLLAPREAARHTRAASGGGSRARRLAPVTAVLALGAVTLVPLIPRYPYPNQPASLPPYFTTAAVQRIAAGSLVLTYPYDIDPDNEAMLWQAASGMRFRIFGGQAARPGADGKTTSTVADLEPVVVQQLFRSAMYGPASASAPNGASAPAPGVAAAALQAFCARYGVTAVVADPLGADPRLAISALTAAFGAPVVAGGVEVWYLGGRRT